MTGARELAAQLTAGATRVEVLVEEVVTKCAADLVALIEINASHRPGPNTPTGDYRSSWGPPEPVAAGTLAFALSVSTDRAQAARLEFGFGGTDAADTKGEHMNASGQAGVDSLGRHYHQQPLPHWGPANDVMEPVFYAAMEAVVAKAITW